MKWYFQPKPWIAAGFIISALSFAGKAQFASMEFFEYSFFAGWGILAIGVLIGFFKSEQRAQPRK